MSALDGRARRTADRPCRLRACGRRVAPRVASAAAGGPPSGAARARIVTGLSPIPGQGVSSLRYSRRVRRILRLSLICLLLLALPFKALAGLAMVGCGPAHHAQMARAAVVNVIVDTEAGGAHSMPAGHADAHSGHSPGAAADAPADGGDTAAADPSTPAADHGAQVAKVKCSNCAPCCAPAAPAPDSDRWSAAEPSSRAAAVSANHYSGVVTDVPHEPPRLILA